MHCECSRIELFSENMDMKKEQRAVISFCIQLKKQPVETYALLQQAYGRKMAQTVFQGPYEGGSSALWFDKKNGGYLGEQ